MTEDFRDFDKAEILIFLLLWIQDKINRSHKRQIDSGQGLDLFRGEKYDKFCQIATARGFK